MDKTNSPTGGPNSNPDFYLGTDGKGVSVNPVGDFIMNRTPAGIAVKTAMDYAKSPEVQEKLEQGKDALAAGVDRARSMIDEIRGAVPQRVKDAVGRAAETLAPAMGPLRRATTVFSDQKEETTRVWKPSARGRNGTHTMQLDREAGM